MEVASTYKICPKCGGKKFGAPSNAKVEVTDKNLDPLNFASFWRRLGAFVIDGLIVGLICGALIAATIYGAVLLESFVAMMGIALSFEFIGITVLVLYPALMHSSKYQATVGKMIFQMKVVDVNSQRITFAKGVVREFATFLSAMILFIGYFMVLFTEKRQALHDQLAGTYVLHVG